LRLVCVVCHRATTPSSIVCLCCGCHVRSPALAQVASHDGRQGFWACGKGLTASGLAWPGWVDTLKAGGLVFGTSTLFYFTLYDFDVVSFFTGGVAALASSGALATATDGAVRRRRQHHSRRRPRRHHRRRRRRPQQTPTWRVATACPPATAQVGPPSQLETTLPAPPPLTTTTTTTRVRACPLVTGRGAPPPPAPSESRSRRCGRRTTRRTPRA
jgi:hypothetical protein